MRSPILERDDVLSIGSLFSGIGGLELGLEWAGHGPVRWQVECDPWCRSVLKAHWPDAIRFDDVRDVGAELPPVDLLCGGFPCQDVSAAGSGAGLAGARSGLWWEFHRIARELRPAWIVVENVASGGARWVDAVRGSLEFLGYQTLPVPLGACDVGAPHLRRRIFIVAAHTDSLDLRQLGERLPGGRPGDLRPCGYAEPRCAGASEHVADAHEHRAQGGASDRSDVALLPQGRAPHDDDAGAPADAHGGRREGVGLEVHRRERGSSGDVADGCDRTRHQCRWADPWASGPPVRGVDDGPMSGLDELRLRSLGNAVVPQCAQVVGELINLLRGE